MLIQECYGKINGDYEGVLSRMGGKTALVEKFAKKFLDDPSCGLLKEAVKNHDYETAFRASHTLKGVACNLGFTKLYEISSKVTGDLRDGKEPDKAQYKQLLDEYEAIIQVMKEL